MDSLIEKVKPLIQYEYERASGLFGPTHHSDHEGYAVLLEEFEEALQELHICRAELDAYWELVKDKNSESEPKLKYLTKVYVHAMLAACESIQVAAMAYKASETITNREANK